MMAEPTGFEVLPGEVVALVFQYLAVQDRCNLARACKHTAHVARDYGVVPRRVTCENDIGRQAEGSGVPSLRLNCGSQILRCIS